MVGSPSDLPHIPLARIAQDRALQQLATLQQAFHDLSAPPVVQQAVEAFAMIVSGGYQPLAVDFANLLCVLEGSSLWGHASSIYAAVPCQVNRLCLMLALQNRLLAS